MRRVPRALRRDLRLAVAFGCRTPDSAVSSVQRAAREAIATESPITEHDWGEALGIAAFILRDRATAERVAALELGRRRRWRAA